MLLIYLISSPQKQTCATNRVFMYATYRVCWMNSQFLSSLDDSNSYNWSDDIAFVLDLDMSSEQGLQYHIVIVCELKTWTVQRGLLNELAFYFGSEREQLTRLVRRYRGCFWAFHMSNSKVLITWLAIALGFERKQPVKLVRTNVIVWDAVTCRCLNVFLFSRVMRTRPQHNSTRNTTLCVVCVARRRATTQ